MTLVQRRSRFTAADVTIDAHSANPPVEDLRQALPDAYRAALSAAGPAPTLFASGNLPSFTASGLAPELLLQLPYTARHAAAAEPDRAVVHAIFELAADDPFLQIDHEGLTAAERRVHDWASGRMDRTSA